MEGPNLSTSNTVAAPNEEPNSNSSSLTLSLTPPLSDPPKDETSTISEHLFSIENDRSLQEIEVTNLPGNFSLVLQNLPVEVERISQEPKPPSLNSSFNNSSIISLNGLERFISTNMESRSHARSILEEILGDEQFKSDSESKDESLDIFANVDLDDKLLNSYNCGKSANFNLSLKNDSINSYDEVCKRVRDFEELVAIKDNTIAALTSELDSFREMLSNTSSNSLGTSTTEYKQFQDECHNKLLEYHNALVHKDDQIEKLTNSLQQCILNREEMKQHLKNEIVQLQEQLQKTSNLLKEHKCVNETEYDFDDFCSKFEEVLNPSQIDLFNELKMAFSNHIEMKKRGLENEISNLKTKFDADKFAHDSEITRLKDIVENVKHSSDEVLELKQELDSKHSKEMEELRTYFEKKCADLEKNFSEEVFSQQSRKMSGSSSATDTELSSDFVFNQPGPGGDHKVDYTKKDITKLRQSLTQMASVMDNFNMNELTDEEFEQLKAEIGKFELRNIIKYDLTIIKNELQNKYHAELEILREDFDNRVDLMNVENETKLRNLEKKYLEEIDDLNVQLRGRISTTTQQEVRLVANDNIDDDWPEDLLQLKARFAEKYQQEIIRLNEEHLEEISRLKEEHVKILNGALERARRRSLRDADSLSKGELELLKERDLLKKQTLSLRNLLGELIKYFTQCEDELNNTLVEELITKNFTQIEKELEMTSPRDSLSSVKRVHITPNFSDLINLIDNSPDNDLESIDLKSELGSCLQKLKSEANAILSLSTSVNKNDEKIDVPRPKSLSLEKEMTSLTRRLISETQIKNELAEQLTEAKSIIQFLETGRGVLENQLEELLENQKILEADLLKARDKIAELIENGHKEIVSEGYGEDGHRTVKGLAEAVATLAVLQEKARSLSENPESLNPNIMHLIEDLVRVADKIVEESRKDRDDLKQQVEHLEQQLRDMSKLREATEKRCKEVENERTEAVDKIFELRDIIRDLEDQVKTRTVAEEELRNIVVELEAIVKHQAGDELHRPRDVSDTKQFHQYVDDLENEVQRLRLSTELVGNEGALQQIKNHLCDFETTLDKQTKDLEGLHSAMSTSCSSPSEDMSIRDVVHQDPSVYGECEVPLQQLARLKEKLMRHSRAEDAAVKRIRDLEMQMVALKAELEESQNEREILRKQISDHLVLISNLQIRLDEQRIRAEHIEKQTNTSLEVQNYDLKSTVASLEERVAKRDKTIAQLKVNIEETKRRLEDRERELSANKEDAMVVQMQEQLEFLRSENLKLKSKIDKEAMLPNLVENIISDKNSDIEMLRERLSETERQLELFTSLNLDKKEIESLNKLRLSGISFHDLVDLENLEHGRKLKNPIDSLSVTPIETLKLDKTVLLGNESEISTIEKVNPSPFFSLQVPHHKANSTEKHVRFEDEVETAKITELQNQIAEKDQLIEDYENRFQRLQELQTKVEQLQLNLEETEASLKKATETFQEDQKKNEDEVKAVRSELEEQRCQLNQKEEELETCRRELREEREYAVAKSKDLKALQKTKSELKNSLRAREAELKSHEEALKIQNEELKKLQDDIAAVRKQNESIAQSIKDRDEMIEKLKRQNEDLGKELVHFQHLVAEKEKVIDQMEADSKSLHINLETIQSKLQESGNVVDLGRRLREEQKKNSVLYEELHALKAQLLGAHNKSLDEIAGQVQRELDYSAYLDSTLINAVGDSSLENEDVEALRLALKKQKSVNKQLAKSKEQAEKRFEDLECEYRLLKKELDTVQYDDAMLIGEMKSKLDSALHNKLEDDRILRSEKNVRSELEGQLKSMKHEIKKLNSQANSFPDMSREYNRGLTKIISNLEEENTNLKQELKMMIESNGRDLASKNEEISLLESKLEGLKYTEQVLTENVIKMKAELEAKTNELVNNKALMAEMSDNRKKAVKQAEHKPKSSDLVPEQLMEKIRELNNVVKDNKQMVDLIARLTHEKTVLEDRIAALEEHNHNIPFDDPTSRANYLFAKYLRSDSFRKALAWQKLYLIRVLESYQRDPVPGLSTLPAEQRKTSKRKTPLLRFKATALMVMSICRMKYLVKRWHSGKRIVHQRTYSSQKVQFQVGQPVSSQNFTTNVNKEPKSALNQPKTDMPYFGTSPPSKEPSALKIQMHPFSFQPNPNSAKTDKKIVPRKLEPSNFQQKQEIVRPPLMGNGNQSRSTRDTLTSPAMLSKYIERFNQIQEKLGLDSLK